jgi:hypothetical protein
VGDAVKEVILFVGNKSSLEAGLDFSRDLLSTSHAL